MLLAGGHWQAPAYVAIITLLIFGNLVGNCSDLRHESPAGQADGVV